MFAEITSANVVGYQTIDVPTGFSMRSATFKAIDGDYLISDIKVTNAAGYGGDYVQKVNSDGTWGQMYFYLTMDGTGYVDDGWYKDDFGGEPVTDEDVLGVGEALFVTSAGDMQFVYAGSVIDGKATYNAPAGFSMVGNPTPVNVMISDIEMENVAGFGGDYVQKVNTDGTWGDMYFYLTMDGTGYVDDGWYKDDFGGEPVTESDILEPSESLFVTVAADTAIKFPSAL